MSTRYHQHYHWVPSVPLLNICWAERDEETGRRWDNEHCITGPRAVALNKRLTTTNDHDGELAILEEIIAQHRESIING